MGLLYIIGTIVFISLTLFLLAYWESRQFGTSTREELGGILSTPLDSTFRKNANLRKTLALFEKNKELTKSHVRKALSVSSRTAVRYLDELERQGKITQVGKTGRSVTYKKKN